MFISHLIDIILHLNIYLGQWVQAFGNWTYLILFVVLFCETGLVIFPFLPGDSLLFAVGALASLENSHLNLFISSAVMFAAALSGDLTNYWVGRKLGGFLVTRTQLIRRDHLLKTENFYERHGSKTVVIARFIPIIRTVAPFVAGLGSMRFRRFVTFSIAGAALWIFGLSYAGYHFGNIPMIQRNFHVVIFAIIAISLLPVVISHIAVMSSRAEVKE